MPYSVKKVGSKYKVMVHGRSIGTHPSKAAAQRQIRAIHAKKKR